jgi:glycosyltransferase involved in cell wall biosynthesis
MSNDAGAMKVVNVVIGEATGGRWQAFCDFGKALESRGVKVIYLTRPQVEGLAALKSRSEHAMTVRCSGHYDLLATWQAMRILRQEQPDVILVHCSRSLALMKRASRGRIPVIATLHNQKIKRMLKADAFFCISEKIRRLVAEAAGPSELRPALVVPNMVVVPEGAKFSPQPYREPPVIGVLSRLVPYKGIDVFLQALADLRTKGLRLRAIIGGEGESSEQLKRQVLDLGLEQVVDFRGWIQDKARFFSEIDIACVPSLHEPFGIVLLEAYLYGRPLVATDADGPLEVCRDGRDALLARKGDPGSLAACLEALLLDQERAHALARQGFDKVATRYSMATVGKELLTGIENTLSGFHGGLRS